MATDMGVRTSTAHRSAVTQSTQDIARFLLDNLGAALTAHIAGVDRRTISRWAEGSPARADVKRTCERLSRCSS